CAKNPAPRLSCAATSAGGKARSSPSPSPSTASTATSPTASARYHASRSAASPWSTGAMRPSASSSPARWAWTASCPKSLGTAGPFPDALSVPSTGPICQELSGRCRARACRQVTDLARREAEGAAEGAIEGRLARELVRDCKIEDTPVSVLPGQELSQGRQQVPPPDVAGEAAFGFEEPVDRRARPAGARADEINRELGGVEVPLDEALHRIELRAAQRPLHLPRGLLQTHCDGGGLP